MPRVNRGARLESVKGRPGLYIVWYEAGRQRRRSTGTTDSREAEAQLAAFLRERELAARPAGPAEPDEYLIESALDYYGTVRAPKVADPARIGFALSPLLDFWAGDKVSAITEETCGAYCQWRGKAPATLRRELATLRAALIFAQKARRLTLAPHVYLPEAPEGKDRWLTQSEAAALLNAARNSYANVRLYLPLFILIGLYTGARKEAILSLRWPQVDLDAGRIDFAPIGTRRTTKRKVRAMPIPKRLLTFLRLARQRGTDLGYVVHDSGARIKDIGGAWDGDPEHRGQGSFGGACKKAALIGVTPHTLRHTCGTWMAQRGVPLHDIGGWLGHTDARTSALYAHHHPDHMHAALAAADRR